MSILVNMNLCDWLLLVFLFVSVFVLVPMSMSVIVLVLILVFVRVLILALISDLMVAAIPVLVRKLEVISICNYYTNRFGH